MPKQWKWIALYMVMAYLAFIIAIHIARDSVDADMRHAPAAGESLP